MTAPATRVALVVVGVAFAAFGIVTLVDDGQALSVLPWAVAPVIVHDALLAPAIVALSWFASRALPSSVKTPVMVGFVVSGALVVVSVPVVVGAGALPDNPTLLDRNYIAGLGAALVALWLGVALTLIINTRRHQAEGSHA